MKRIIFFAFFVLTSITLFAEGKAEVTIYTMPGCGRCSYTISYLKKNNIPYTEYSTSDKDNNMKMWRAISDSGKPARSISMPVVVINGQTYFSMPDLKGFTESIPSLLAAGGSGSGTEIKPDIIPDIKPDIRPDIYTDEDIPSDNKEPQKFDSVPENRFFYIKSVQSGSENLGYWDQPGNPGIYKRGDNLALYSKDRGLDQQFRFRSAGNGMYYIESRNGGVVDVAGNKKENGTNVLIWSGHGGSNQIFGFKYIGDGRWKIYAHNGSVVCTAKSYRNDSNVQIWEEGEEDWMEWFFEDARTGIKYAPDGSGTHGSTK